MLCNFVFPRLPWHQAVTKCLQRIFNSSFGGMQPQGRMMAFNECPTLARNNAQNQLQMSTKLLGYLWFNKDLHSLVCSAPGCSMSAFLPFPFHMLHLFSSVIHYKGRGYDRSFWKEFILRITCIWRNFKFWSWFPALWEEMDLSSLIPQGQAAIPSTHT